MHTHGWIPIEKLKNGYTQTDSMTTVKKLREQSKSYGLGNYSTLRKPGLTQLIAEARAPVFRERLKRALKTGRYPALRGDIDNPHKKSHRIRETHQFKDEVSADLRAQNTSKKVTATAASD